MRIVRRPLVRREFAKRYSDQQKQEIVFTLCYLTLLRSQAVDQCAYHEPGARGILFPGY
jgi:hypothetical protein